MRSKKVASFVQRPEPSETSTALDCLITTLENSRDVTPSAETYLYHLRLELDQPEPIDWVATPASSHQQWLV